MGILFTLGIAGYNEFNRQQILDQTTKQVKSDLRLAQQKALAGEKDCSVNVCGGATAGCGNDVTGEKSLDNWSVSFTRDSYTIYGDCGGTEFNQKTTTLPDIFSVTPPSPNPIQFKVLGQGTNITGQATITLRAFSKTKTITITSSGEIN